MNTAPANDFLNFVAQTSPFPVGLEIKKARGTTLFTTDGKEYLDLISGISVANAGHCHPKIVAAIKEQAEKYLHVMVYGEYVQAPQVAFAKLLVENLPSALNNVYFVNSGTEANEGALKLAKRATGRSRIISFKGAYHGSTHGSLSVSSNENKKYRYRPLLPEVYFLEFGSIQEFDLIDSATAAVIIEPVQGDAGVRQATQTFFEALRKRCTEVGALLIFDEIQTGFGRTGKLFAFEHYGVVPDVLTIGKAMAGGMPMGAFVADKARMELFTKNPVLGHINTFGGNPVCAAAALANLQVLLEENLIARCEEKGQWLEQKLNHPAIVEIRRIGLMLAVEFESAEIVNRIFSECLQRGVITYWFLSCPDSFRLAPPLCITDEEIDKATEIINASIESAVNSGSSA